MKFGLGGGKTRGQAKMHCFLLEFDYKFMKFDEMTGEPSQSALIQIRFLTKIDEIQLGGRE